MPSERPEAETSISLMMRVRRDPADVGAWEEFVRRYQPMIREWCLRWGAQPTTPTTSSRRFWSSSSPR